MLEWLLACNWERILLETAAGIALALIIRRYICLLVYVKGRSMQDTLQNGEVLFALRRRLHGEIRRFDVVLCRYPNRKELFVKRVVALPGETISVDENVLYVNGEAIEEPFPRRPHLRPMQEREVGGGAYFVMGDNRTSSRDSRAVGAIDLERIEAVAKCVVFPLRRIRKIP